MSSKGEKRRLIDELPPTVRSREMKVLMLGGPRTGTSALFAALSYLGFKPYHHAAVGTNPELITRDYRLWSEAILAKFKGQGIPYGKPEFDKMLGDYDAVGDVPPSLFVEDLLLAYPDAKVILTLRDPDTWHASLTRTIIHWHQKLSLRILSVLEPEVCGPLMTCMPLSIDIITGGNWDDKETAKSWYAAHYENVRRLVPKERLLEFGPDFRWEPLCKFLGVELPPPQYPRINSVVECDLVYGMAVDMAIWTVAKKVVVGLLPVVALGLGGYVYKTW